MVLGIFLTASLLASASTVGVTFLEAKAEPKGYGGGDGSIGAPPGSSGPPPRSGAYGPDHSGQCQGDPVCKLYRKHIMDKSGRELACAVGTFLACKAACDGAYVAACGHMAPACKASDTMQGEGSCPSQCGKIVKPLCEGQPTPPTPPPPPTGSDLPICTPGESSRFHAKLSCLTNSRALQTLVPSDSESGTVTLAVEEGDEVGSQVEKIDEGADEEIEEEEETEVEEEEDEDVEDVEDVETSNEGDEE